MTHLAINPEHDPQALHQAFTATGRLQVPNFLQADSAEYLSQLITGNDTWYLSYNEGDQNYESLAADFDALAPVQQHRFMSKLYARARDGFQYCFKQYYITKSLELGENKGHPLHQCQDFVNSPAYLDFMRTLTGSDEIRLSDCYASLYDRGHFLTEHNDLHHQHDRVAAFVISMTRDWNPNWGGYLAFFDEQGNVQEAFKPTFNTLNIFSIPRRHAVQMVAPFAGHARTSLLGWLQR